MVYEKIGQSQSPVLGLIFTTIRLVYREADTRLVDMQGFTTVPFKTESSHGINQINGVAKFSSAGIVLEFESKLFGVIGGGVKEVRLPKEEILDIKFRKGIFRIGAKIVIRTKTFSKLAELPSSEGKLTMNLVREDFERGQSAVEQLQKELDRQAEELPPAPSRVDQLFADDTEEETGRLTDGDR